MSLHLSHGCERRRKKMQLSAADNALRPKETNTYDRRIKKRLGEIRQSATMEWFDYLHYSARVNKNLYVYEQIFVQDEDLSENRLKSLLKAFYLCTNKEPSRSRSGTN